MSIIEYSVQFETKLRRKNHSTPKNYLDFLRNYKLQLSDNRKMIDNKVTRLQGGLEKIVEASEKVAIMQVKLEERNKEVLKKKEEVETLLEEITSNTKIANEKQEEAQIKKSEIKEQKVLIEEDEKQANAALEKAMPALEQARLALSVLDKKDITEVKTMAAPPEGVRQTLYCVAILDPNKKRTTEDWMDCKNMMGDMDFFTNLNRYEADKIKES